MKRTFLPLICLVCFSTYLRANGLPIGASLPSLTVTNDEGQQFDLADFISKGTTVIFFYPKAHTGGCTQQACSLRDGWSELQTQGVRILGVSSDKVQSQASFRAKHELPFPLIADTDHAVAKAFNKGRWSRQAYIFKDGKLVWRDLKASTAKQYEDIANALKSLQ